MKYLIGAIVCSVFVAVLGFQVFMAARKPEDELSRCRANMADLALVARMYMSENDGHLPLRDWETAFISSRPPKLRRDYPDASTSCPSALRYGYAMNAALLGKKIDPRATDIMFFETGTLLGSAVEHWPPPLPRRHKEGIWIARVNGSVELLEPNPFP